MHNHPLGAALAVRRAERLYHLQTLQRLLLALYGRSLARDVAQLITQRIQVDIAEQIVDSLCAHLRDELLGVGIVEIVVIGILRLDQVLNLFVLLLVQQHAVFYHQTVFIVLMTLAYLLACQRTGAHYDILLVVDDGIQLLGRDTQQRRHLARQRTQIPDMRYGHHETDMSHALTTHFLLRNLHAATLADDAFVADTLVLTAVALVVLRRTEDTLAEQTITLGLIGTIVNRLRLQYLAAGELHNLIGRCQANTYSGKTSSLAIILFESHTNLTNLQLDNLTILIPL